MKLEFGLHIRLIRGVLTSQRNSVLQHLQRYPDLQRKKISAIDGALLSLQALENGDYTPESSERDIAKGNPRIFGELSS